jgi:predicted PhzF superfamily epimerase YddE/YHI9
MGRHFAILDVFTDRRFGGNPLAVVLALLNVHIA